MLRINLGVLAFVVSMTAVGVMPSIALAQKVEAAASSPKQAQKAQRVADRKTRRAQTNAELSTLKKNGYNPAKDQTSYPQSIQDAEKRSATAKASSAP